MKLSFVVPVFKTEQYLARCLDSLLAQTDGDFEAIVVDDASPEVPCGRGVPAASGGTGKTTHDAAGTLRPHPAAEIVSKYDSRFRCVRHEKNRSTFQAKATGAKLATGDYIVPLDSDDYVLPRLVEELKRALAEGERREARDESGDARQSNKPTIQQSNNSPDLIVYQMEKEFRGKVYPVKYNHPAGRCTGAEALEKLFAGRIFMPVCGKAIRREVFLAAYEGLGVGPDFYLNFTDDLCWLIPIFLNTKTVAFVDYPGYRYWRHEDSMTKDVMEPEKVRLLAEQSRRSINAVVAYAERLGAAAPTVLKIRTQIYPTIRWLMRDMGQRQSLLEEVYGADPVAETLRWDAASGGKVAKLLRHLRTYGLAATAREILARARGEEI